MKKGIVIFTMIISFIAMGITGCAKSIKHEETSVYYDGRITQYRGVIHNECIYLPVEMVGTLLKNEGIYADVGNARLNIDIRRQNIMLGDQQVTNFVKNNAGEIYVPLRDFDKKYYFPIEAVEQFFKVKASNHVRSKIEINYFSGTDKIAKIIKKNAEAVSSLENGSGELFTLTEGETVKILESTNNYYKIKSNSMKSGYVLKENVKVYNLDLSNVDFYAPQKKKKTDYEGKINIAWQAINKTTPPAPSKYKGLDVLAPTWFDLKVNGDGSVINEADKQYTKTCHERGYQVWATMTNNMSQKGAQKFTTKMMSQANLMHKTIAQYIMYSAMYDVDGINIDFERVHDSDRENLVEFMKTLRIFSERQGLSLSIDVLIPAPWNIEYDREALAKSVDYICLMSYDEHYGGSKTPGSISSMPWTEKAVKDTLKEGVPSEKLLMGIPLYTRVWCVKSDGTQSTRYAASMKWVQDKINNDNLRTNYLENIGQNYVEYKDGNETAKIWIEDNTSIANRLRIIHKYNLAGSCCWQYSFGVPEVWETFYNYR